MGVIEKKNYRYEKGNVLATKEPVRVPHIKLKADEGIEPDISNSLQTWRVSHKKTLLLVTKKKTRISGWNPIILSYL